MKPGAIISNRRRLRPRRPPRPGARLCSARMAEWLWGWGPILPGLGGPSWSESKWVAGAQEVDMVLNIGELKGGQLKAVYEDILAVVEPEWLLYLRRWNPQLWMWHRWQGL